MQMMSVSSLNTKIKSLLEATFMHVVVEGEVSAVTYHTSGHLYFTVKDDRSALRCVMWRSSVAKMKFRIEKGMHIVIHGSLSVYTPRGEYQLQAVKIEPFGQGALALAFEQLKEKLKAKGYFDTARKKPLPKFPGRIALVTAKESAALADMLRIIETRWPLVEVVVVDTLVQGETAAPSIVRALRIADTLDADIVVVGRGGGSKEDLWAFNEEIVADAIYAMRTPVVSAVGHEVDVLISDMVADMRAPTPSAAMEMILPDRNEALYMLDETLTGFHQTIKRLLARHEERMHHLLQLLQHAEPTVKIDKWKEEFTRLEEALIRHFVFVLERKSHRLHTFRETLSSQIRYVLERKEQTRVAIEERLRLADPSTRSHTGWVQLIKQGKKSEVAEISVGDRFELQDISGIITAECLSKKKLL